MINRHQKEGELQGTAQVHLNNRIDPIFYFKVTLAIHIEDIVQIKEEIIVQNLNHLTSKNLELP